MVLAAAEGDLGVLAQYGVLGAFALLLVLFARTSYKRETDRSDRLETENTRLNTSIQEKVIPALVAATAALEQAAQLIHDIERERDRDRLRRGGIDGG